tara:strand:+ start:397 stop:4794 length:4398 start_codon:yes stop_codon:yes gene_type:complete
MGFTATCCKLKFSLLLLTFFLFLSVPQILLGQLSPDELRAEKLYVQGLVQLADKKFESAERTFKRVIELTDSIHYVAAKRQAVWSLGKLYEETQDTYSFQVLSNKYKQSFDTALANKALYDQVSDGLCLAGLYLIEDTAKSEGAKRVVVLLNSILDLVSGTEFERLEPVIYNDLAIFFQETGEDSKASRYIEMAISSSRKFSDWLSLGSNLFLKTNNLLLESDSNPTEKQQLAIEILQVYNRIGIPFYKFYPLLLLCLMTPDVNAASDYLLKAELIAKKYNSQYNLALVYESKAELQENGFIKYDLLERCSKIYAELTDWNAYSSVMKNRYVVAWANENIEGTTQTIREIESIIDKIQSDSVRYELLEYVNLHYTAYVLDLLEQQDPMNLKIFVDHVLPIRMKRYDIAKSLSDPLKIDSSRADVEMVFDIVLTEENLPFLTKEQTLKDSLANLAIHFFEEVGDTTMWIEALMLSVLPNLDSPEFSESKYYSLKQAEKLALAIKDDEYLEYVYQFLHLYYSFNLDFKNEKEYASRYLVQAHKLKLDNSIVNATAQFVNACIHNGLSFDNVEIQVALTKVTRSNLESANYSSIFNYATLFFLYGGDVEKADEIFQIGIKILENGFVLLPSSYHAYISFQMHTGQYEKAKHYINLEIDLDRKHGYKEVEAKSLIFLGETDLLLGNYRQSIEATVQAYEYFQKKENISSMLYTLLSLIQANKLLGNHTEVIHFIDETLDLAISSNDTFFIGRALSFKSIYFGELGAHDSTLFYMEASLPFLRSTSDRIMLALRLYESAFVNNDIDLMIRWQNFIRNEDVTLEKLHSQFRQLLSTVVGSLDPRYKLFYSFGTQKLIPAHQAYLHLARAINFYFNDRSDYQLEFDHALASALKDNDYRNAANIQKIQSLVNYFRGDYNLAYEGFVETFDLFDKAYGSINDLEAIRTYSNETDAIIPMLIVSATHDFEQYFKDKQLIEILDKSEQVSARALLFQLGESIQQTADNSFFTSEKKQLQDRINRISVQIRSEESDGQRRLLEIEKDQLYNQLLLFQDKSKEANDKLAEGNLLFEPINIEQLQKNFLQDNQVLIKYFLYPAFSFAIALTKNGVYAYDVLDQYSLAVEIKAIKNLYKHYGVVDSETELLNLSKRGYKLFKTLLGPVHEAFGGDLTDVELVIIPDKELYLMPFEVLVTDSLRTDTDRLNFKSLPFLIKQSPITYSPSISIYYHLSKAKNKRGTKSILAVGNNTFNSKTEKDNDFNHVSRNLTDLLGEIPDLNFAEEEASLVYKLYSKKRVIKWPLKEGSLLFIGKKATENRLKSVDMTKYNYIHFSTHGFVDEYKPHFSTLLLNEFGEKRPRSDEDGLLQAFEIYDLELNADLVTLSACNTGLGKIINGEGVIGLYQAFFSAGAHSVCASLWSIDDESTLRFMEYFYSLLKEGISKSKALQQTKLYMIHNSQYNSPFFWAPFVLMGES